MAINWTLLTAGKSIAGSIANYANRSDLPTADILTEAQAKIYQTLRCEDMLTRSVLAIAAAATSVTLPSDYLAMQSFTPYGWAAPMLYVPPNQMTEQVDADGTVVTGTPSQFMVLGQTAYFDVALTEAMSGRLIYYKIPAPLSASNETNFLTTKYPTLLRYACLMVASDHMKQADQQQAYFSKMMAELNDVKVADDLNKMTRWTMAG